MNELLRDFKFILSNSNNLKLEEILIDSTRLTGKSPYLGITMNIGAFQLAIFFRETTLIYKFNQLQTVLNLKEELFKTNFEECYLNSYYKLQKVYTESLHLKTLITMNALLKFYLKIKNIENLYVINNSIHLKTRSNRQLDILESKTIRYL